mgnify:FL=1
MTEQGDLPEALRASARGLIEDLADRLDLGGVKARLIALERADRASRPRCEVVSAIALDQGLREAVEARLAAWLGPDVEVGYRVDPTILGGLVVRMGDRYVDGSVGGRLAQLHQSLVGEE